MFLTSIEIHELGNNCIQTFHLGLYIVGYTVGNIVLQPRASGVMIVSLLIVRFKKWDL